MDSFAVTLLMEDLLLDLQVPQTPRVVITADTHTSNLLSQTAYISTASRWWQRCWWNFTRSFPGSVQTDARRPWTPAHCDPRCLPLVHRCLNTEMTVRRHRNSSETPLPPLPPHLSRLHSFTEPSAAHDARLTSDWSREVPACGRKTMEPTLVQCPGTQWMESWSFTTTTTTTTSPGFTHSSIVVINTEQNHSWTTSLLTSCSDQMWEVQRQPTGQEFDTRGLGYI